MMSTERSTVVGVPANNFGKQEPGSNEEIAQFCSSKYGVTFPMLAKVVVKGNGICPLYKHLTAKETDPKFGGAIKWNFNKFLIDRNGNIIARFPSPTTPEDPKVMGTVEKALAAKGSSEK